jgi:hypothetical protein
MSEKEKELLAEEYSKRQFAESILDAVRLEAAYIAGFNAALARITLEEDEQIYDTGGR